MENESAMSARVLVATAAGLQEECSNRKSWLAQAARNTRLSFRSIKSVWYGEIDDPNHPTIRILKYTAAQRAKEKAAERAEVIENFRRLLAMRDALVAKDAEFNQPQIDALEYSLGLMVGDVGAGEIRKYPR